MERIQIIKEISLTAIMMIVVCAVVIGWLNYNNANVLESNKGVSIGREVSFSSI